MAPLAPLWIRHCLTRDLVLALVSGGAVKAINDVLLVDLLRRRLDVKPDERITADDAVRYDLFDSKIFESAHHFRIESNRAADSNSNRISKL